MLHYYRQLFRDPQRERDDLSRDLKVIEDYLSRAIASLKKKEAIRAKWNKLDTPRSILRLQGRLYKVPKQEVVVSEALCGYQADECIDARGAQYVIKQKIDVNKAILDKPYKSEPFFAKDNRLHEGRIEYNRPNVNDVIEKDSDYFVYIPKNKTCEETLAIEQQLTNDEITDFLSSEISHLRDEKKNSYRVSLDKEGCIENGLSVENLKGKKLFSQPYDLELTLVPKNTKGREEGLWIELVEFSEEANEDETLSPLRHFFDDDISIEDDKGNHYTVRQARPEDYQLRLQKKGERYDCYPPEGTILSVKVNTYQLQLQRESVRLLRERPLKSQLPLLQLFRNKSSVSWQEFEPQYPKEWFVLKEANRPGCQEQRNFVAKALQTPDYAFLAGPPGSGKTTVILELIGQLVSQGKRVLLCGSTHVAIDNVLERLDEQGFIDKLGITALRIGDKSRISERVKHFQIDEVLCGCSEKMHNLVRASANLVCGTTMGILQYPDFKRGPKDPSPIVSDFDFLIIDESSKTTFQEFLVPALHAQRWVLVGDVMQLSPYTERELVEANIRELSIKKESLNADHQQAIYLLHHLESLYKEGGKETLYGYYAIPVNGETLIKLKEEFLSGRGKDTFDNKRYSVVFIDKYNYKDFNRLRLSPYELIFIDRTLINKRIIPETHAVLWDNMPKNWERSEYSFAFRAMAPKIKSTFGLKEKGIPAQSWKELDEFLQSISYKLYSRSWAGEVAWRIDREHQTRLQSNSKGRSYAQQIGDLMPLEDRGLWISEINRIAAIAYPSILEALELGIISLSKKELDRGDRFSTLVKGFEEKALSKRREILVYQHRMHPELSLFPRQRFYYARKGQAEALCDNPKLKRSWEYKRYPHRNHWVEIEGRTSKGKNDREAKRMMYELNHFAEYARKNSPSDGVQRPWEIACLTFYRGQERLLRDLLRQKTKSQSSTHFEYEGLKITLCTVDRFQGQEADVVFLSMVQTQRVGFMDSPNRLNVALTRARYQNVIIGNKGYFAQQTISEDLKRLALDPLGGYRKLIQSNNNSKSYTRQGEYESHILS